LRYTREPQQASFTQTSNNLAFRNLGTIDAKRDEGALTWRLNASYKWTPDIMTYVSIARGFKPGGFNMTRLPDFDNFQFRPETNINYEAGVKSSLRSVPSGYGGSLRSERLPVERRSALDL
jgi:iron complex outermembrane receptor protein